MSLCVYFDKRCSSFLSFTNNFPCYSDMQIFGCFARSLLMQTVSMAIYWKLPWKRTFQRISDTLSKLLCNISFRKRVTNLYKISEMSRVTKSYSPATAWWIETKPRPSNCPPASPIANFSAPERWPECDEYWNTSDICTISFQIDIDIFGNSFASFFHNEFIRIFFTKL